MNEYDISESTTRALQNNDFPSFDDDCACVGRLTEQDLADMPDDTRDIGRLRRMLSEIFNIKLQNNYARLETDCDIKRDTFQKALRAKHGRNITYPLLAKFCIGTKLSEQEARELFLLIGHDLDDKRIRSDFILIRELRNGGDILEFDEDLKKHGYPSVLSNADSVSANRE